MSLAESKKLISPRIELGTFCVLSRCHNRLDHETNYVIFLCNISLNHEAGARAKARCLLP